MAGTLSSYRARLAVMTVTLLALSPVLVTVRAAAAAPRVPCDTSWLDGVDGQWSDAANWSDGVPTTTTSACITKGGTYTVHLTGFQEAAAISFGASNGSQTLSIEAGCEPGPAELHLGTSSVVSAHGHVVLTDTGDCEYAWLDQLTGTLTNNGTIVSANSGTTQARYLYGDVANAGSISVDATLTSDDTGHTHLNTGAVSIAAGASWEELDSFWNAGGSVAVAAGGIFDQSDGTFIQGNGTTSGNVVVHDGGLEYAGSGASSITTHSNVDLSGDIAAGQSLTLESTCDTDPAYVAVSAPWTNAGTLTLTDTGDCQYAWLDQMSGTFTNTGTVHITDTDGDQVRFIYGDVANAGTIAVQGTMLSDDGGHTHTNTGTVSITGAGWWDDEDSFRNLGGSLTTSGDGVFSQETPGTFTQGNGATVGDVFVNATPLLYSGTGASEIRARGTVKVKGNIAVGQTLIAQGTCELGTSTLSMGAPLTNAGTISLTNLPTCSGAGITQVTGTLTNTGTIRVANAGGAARSLQGSVENNGTLVLESSTNLNTLGGTITNGPTGTIETHLKSNTVFARLTGTSAMQLGGTLSIVREGTFVPKVGKTFETFDCTACTGSFDTVVGRSVNDQAVFTIDVLPAAVTLRVVKASTVADLVVTGSGPGSAPSGSTFSYTYIVQNAGPNRAKSIVLSTTLPPGVTFSSASAGCTENAGTVTCTYASITPSKTVTVTITVVAGAPGKTSDAATATAATVDPTPADATAKVRVTIV